MNSPLLKRLTFRTRQRLAVSILLLYIFLSILHSLRLYLGDVTQHPLSFYFLWHGLLIWSVMFALAFYLADWQPSQLFLRWSFKAIPLAILWSLLLRLGIVPLCLLFFFLHFKLVPAESFLQLIPVHDIKVHPEAAFTLCLSLSISAGLFEELWRTSLYAGFKALYPQSFNRWWKVLGLVGFVSVLFGAAHLYEGPYGVAAATFLGFYLSAILLLRKSYWEAALAHLFFDATSFTALFLMISYSSSLGNYFVLAGQQGNLEKIKMYLQFGCEVNSEYTTQDPRWKQYHWTCLSRATAQKHLEVMRYLLAKGANPNLFHNEEPPLVQATRGDFSAGVLLLIHSGAQLDASRDGHTTALAVAAYEGNLEILKILVEAGAPDQDGAKYLAKEAKHEDIVRYLEDKK